MKNYYTPSKKEIRFCIDCGNPQTVVKKRGKRARKDDSSYRCKMCAAIKRAQDPKWQEKNSASLQKLYKDPEWRNKVKTANIKRSQTLEWKTSFKEMVENRSNNPMWKKRIINAAKLRSKNPTWIENHKKGLQQLAQNIGWREKHKGEKNSSWKGGISFLPYCHLFNDRRKRATSKFFGDMCICCGRHVSENITKHGKHYTLSTHHITHDKEQGCNGKPFNLVPMCIKCHAKEKHYEGEYRTYINKTLEEGFKWGIWSKEQYEKDVMYNE